MLIGGIKFGRYGKITRASLAITVFLNGSLVSVTCQVGNIRGNYDTLTASLSLTEEEAEK